MSESRDAERVVIEPPQLGGPVDPPADPRTLYGTVTGLAQSDRPPVVPAWVRNAQQRRQVAALAARTAGYVAVYHTTRTPKYLARVAVYAPLGVWVGLARLIRWTFDTESWSIRQNAARRNDVGAFLELRRDRSQLVRTRLWVVGPGVGLLLIAAALLALLAPVWVRWAVLGAVAVPLAWVGRPAGRPITDRTVTLPRFTRLTGEMVRDALCSIGLAGLKDRGAIEFVSPIHRDGPGWLARVNLPAGVEAVDVLERRGRLSSGLRLPIDQVWPTVGPAHAGQLDLWVGYAPASKMGQPTWSLTKPNAVTSVFAEHEFGTDQRQRPVRVQLFARNFLIGGVPGSGKSYAARTLAMIAALDPTCELKIVELKGTADFGDLAPLCSTYVCGVDDASLQAGAEVIAWGLAEAERRGRRIAAARQRGEAPEGKVTPELAARAGSGLHPVVIVIDEAHELLADKEAAAAAERLIKRGRALGLIVILATQVPDAKSVPPNITRCVTVRWCLAVLDQVANDMILGTGSYKRGLSAAAYRPGVDAGWGIAIGLSEPTAVRSYYPDPAATAAVIARATALRGGMVGGQDPLPPPRDLLDDVLRVFAHVGRPGLHWQRLAELLAEQVPEYADIGPEAVSALLRDAGVPSVDVKVDGIVLKGCRRDAVAGVAQTRQIAAAR